MIPEVRYLLRTRPLDNLPVFFRNDFPIRPPLPAICSLGLDHMQRSDAQARCNVRKLPIQIFKSDNVVDSEFILKAIKPPIGEEFSRTC